MLQTLGVNSLNELIDQTIPAAIRTDQELRLPEGQSEYNYLNELKNKASLNKVYKSYIGTGYYGTITPAAIKRNVFENPGWYTQYTPYQAELAQGRLEALLNFQTMVADLTGLTLSNASLLDEGTSAAEAMTMLYNAKNKSSKKEPARVFYVSDQCFPQTIEVLKARADSADIELRITDPSSFELDDNTFGILLQYPDQAGKVQDHTDLIKAAHDAGAFVTVAADLLSLSLLTPPGEMGADVAVGNTQRFGVPMGYGGPHAAYFATHEKFKRQIPGRIIGVSIDVHDQTAYRMALQTREQHIRREKATSNICTAQSLLAIMAGMYGVYHGPEGITNIAKRIHALTTQLDDRLQEIGVQQNNDHYFDTLQIDAGSEENREVIRKEALAQEVNFRYYGTTTIGISLDETVQPEEVDQIVNIFANATGKGDNKATTPSTIATIDYRFPSSLQRTSEFMTHPVFNSHHSETELMRYLKKLESRDLSLVHSMIPLGSCTMKLNAATELEPVGWPEFAHLHPFVPLDQAQGYQQIIGELEDQLAELTGFAATSLQPNSGAQGEYTGLMVIRANQKDRGEEHRNVALIPSSAHGTNPASAKMAGMKVVIVDCDEDGNIDFEDIKNKAEKYSENLAALMITYPSTHGVFEEEIKEICQLIHDHGGQVYLDGANLNAQLGLTTPGYIGADVCHLNLHKTFAIPHGGGGPGMGPICVKEHLKPYLPSHPLLDDQNRQAISAISAAPWGSASILLISYGYIKMLGKEGLTNTSKYAILNANYLRKRLQDNYPVLYVGSKGHVAHELIVDFRPYDESANVNVEDIAKRMIDYGFHAPTMSWPVPGTMMVEPTESEDKEELDRFCDALLQIREEIREIEEGKVDAEDNLLKQAPHTIEHVASDQWSHPYSRERAAYPLLYTHDSKFWSPVGRINNSYGDRHLFCVCPPIEEYQEEEEKEMVEQ
jgi:glycine dehydrogenase